MFSIIYLASHNTDSEKFEYYEQQTIINDNCWIGARTIILAGSIVSSGCIIGANSLFGLKNCEENCVYGGSPAKIIKKRNISHFEQQNICMYFR